MAYLIDSSVIMALERRKQDVLVFIQGMAVPAALSAVTESEFLLGVHRADSPQRRLRRAAFLERMLEMGPVLPFDLDAARTHAEIWARLLAIGQMIGAHDLLIAATALANSYDVLTLNARHFRRVPGLTVHVPMMLD